MSVADGVLSACSGFLLAVLWMDLIFDTQVRGSRDDELPELVLASVADYYRRATTTSRPMSRLIAAVMVLLLATLTVVAIGGDDPGWLDAASGALAAAPIVLAATRTVPAAVRLGGRADDLTQQSRLARAIYRDHVFCFASMGAFLALRLVAVW